MTITELRTEIYHAIRAASNFHIWGRHAAMQYALKHNCLGLYRLARQLAALNK